MGHNKLSNYYGTLFSLTHHHGYTITDIENLYPYERDIIMEMVLGHLSQVEEQRRRAQG